MHEQVDMNTFTKLIDEVLGVKPQWMKNMFAARTAANAAISPKKNKKKIPIGQNMNQIQEMANEDGEPIEPNYKIIGLTQEQ